VKISSKTFSFFSHSLVTYLLEHNLQHPVTALEVFACIFSISSASIFKLALTKFSKLSFNVAKLISTSEPPDFRKKASTSTSLAAL
jgi:hypothetical protein